MSSVFSIVYKKLLIFFFTKVIKYFLSLYSELLEAKSPILFTNFSFIKSSKLTSYKAPIILLK